MLRVACTRLSLQAEGAPICLLRVVRWVSSSFCLFCLSPFSHRHWSRKTSPETILTIKGTGKEKKQMDRALWRKKLRILKPRFKKLFQKQLELNRSLWLERKEYSRHLERDGGFQGLCSDKDLAPPWCQLLLLTLPVATGSTVGKLDSWVSEIFRGRKESWNLAKGDIQAQVSSHLSHVVPNSEGTEEKFLILVN